MSFKFSTAAFVVGALFFFCLFGINSALECYNCISKKDVNCTSNPTPFLKNCTDVPENIQFTFPLEGLTPNKTLLEYECVTIEINEEKVKNVTITARTCMPKGLSENFFKNQLVQYGLEIKKVKICNSDKCNSTSTIGAGILSLCLSLIILIHQMHGTK